MYEVYKMKSLQKIEKDRKNLIKALQAVQEEKGYLPESAIKEIAEHFSISPVEVEGVISFYSQFKTVKPARYKILVCDGTACHIKGSSLVLNWLNEELNKYERNGEENIFSVEKVACLGCCSLAPVISINDKIYGNLDRKSLKNILAQYKEGEINNDQKN